MALTKLTSNLIEGGTGTDWVTAIQTSNFTAAAGKGYFVNTTSQILYVNLPVGVVGTEIVIQDYAGIFATNKVILNANGSEKIQGSTIEGQITTNNATAVLIYQDATKGWTSQDVTLVPQNPEVSYLVVAGGGGGGSSYAGGGGAGGLRTSWPGGSGGGGASESEVTLTLATNYVVTVGAGGSSGSGVRGGDGSNSVFSTITSIGGGGGASNNSQTASNGGSGGGNSESPSGTQTPAQGTASQGYNGGVGFYGSGSVASGGGGGGAGSLGVNAASGIPGNGGNGLSVGITGSSIAYAGGGGGAGNAGGGNGGSGIGGNGATGTGGGGSVNTGSGGGAGQTGSGGNGASGIVILRYLSVATLTNPGGGLTFTSATDGSYKVIKFTSGTGNIQFN